MVDDDLGTCFRSSTTNLFFVVMADVEEDPELVADELVDEMAG